MTDNPTAHYVSQALEYTSTPYKDQTDPKVVTQHMGPKFNPAQQGLNGAPALAPPMLIDHKNKLFISQTPNILSYLGPKLGLAGDSPDDAFAVAALALTFLGQTAVS